MLLPDLTGRSSKLRSYTNFIVREWSLLKEKSWRDCTAEILWDWTTVRSCSVAEYSCPTRNNCDGWLHKVWDSRASTNLIEKCSPGDSQDSVQCIWALCCMFKWAGTEWAEAFCSGTGMFFPNITKTQVLVRWSCTKWECAVGAG